MHTIKIKNILFFLYLLLTASLTSCSKDEAGSSEEYQPSARRLLPSEIISYSDIDPLYAAIATTLFTYDSQNRIVRAEETLNYPNEMISYKTVSQFFYDSDDIIITKAHATYPEFTQAKVYKRRGLQIYCNEEEFITVDSKLRVTASYDKTNYIYDDKGNLKNMSLAAIREYQIGYTNDDRNGVFRYVNMPHWLLLTEYFGIPQMGLYNNCLKISNNESVDYNCRYQYTYNEDDYPVGIREIPADMGAWKYTYEIKYIDAN